MRFLMLEAYYGGSHKAFMDGLCRHLPHTTEIKTLPARHWKWRMRSAALLFIKETERMEAYDGIVATNMMSVADFKALAGPMCPPVLLYFHENQFDYPPSPRSHVDYQPAMTDLTSAMAADVVAFNSASHSHRFFQSADAFFRRFPKPDLLWVLDTIREKSVVLYPGCDFTGLTPAGDKSYALPRCIVWNHRWEHDKNPSDFFFALEEVRKKNVNFKLMLLGARHARVPDSFSRAMETFREHIICSDYPEDKTDYFRFLSRAHICISTAWQENFGIAVAEAMAAGCLPLLPSRLSYPELLPPEFHSSCLYKDTSGLISQLEWFASCPEEEFRKYQDLRSWVLRFDWKERIVPFNKALEDMVHAKKGTLGSGR
ncbi:DUF3524 domain-containing protein [Desulfobotulus sp. H1]|uniref:tRNA-queuosine alpha-mannosyltransferase n=1 Tax=Desulfobotulus pelophilus TaxID=2823377 RepID=A0ABT3NA68_9BACT|nr:DUF3524 domain-containing protein [Desulfobotulus pelophilus]MCW7754361.1 DUF3524 domain-containing protein [Desulfobotulus pelophilus]